MCVKSHKKVNKMYGTVITLPSEAVRILTATAHTFRSVMEIRDLPEVFCQGPKYLRCHEWLKVKIKVTSLLNQYHSKKSHVE
jgi:hypothetical protein